VRIILNCLAIALVSLGVTTPSFAATSDPGMCLAAYGALAKEQETMGAAGASTIATVAPNYSKIKFADRVRKMTQRYPNDGAIKYGLLTGGIPFDKTVLQFHFILVQAETEDNFGKNSLEILNLAAQCDKDEGFTPAFELVTKKVTPAPAPSPVPPKPTAAVAVDDLLCSVRYFLIAREASASNNMERKNGAMALFAASATAHRKQHPMTDDELKTRIYERAQQLKQDMDNNRLTQAILDNQIVACNARYAPSPVAASPAQAVPENRRK
jgi:hypothetical protein